MAFVCLRKFIAVMVPVGDVYIYIYTSIYIFFSVSAKNSNSKYEIALKEIITLIETIVPTSTINEIRSS